MLISTKGRYALRVMLYLAKHNSEEYIPLKDIADEQDISKKYLESIVVVLSKAGFVDGQHGKGGGYRLAKAPEDYSVASILKLTDGSIAPVACLETEINSCERADECETLPMWKELYKRINDYLESVSLTDLIANGNNDNYVI